MIGAIDIGGTKIAVGLMTAAGQLAAQVQFPTQTAETYRAGLDRIATSLEMLTSAEHTTLESIGVGMTGRMSRVGRLEPNQFLPNWTGQTPAQDLARRFGVPAGIENDADAAALAESRWGSGSGVERLIFVTISTGIGGGIVLGGQLYRGVDGCHPEIGHHVVDPDGPTCFCGARGCWEILASGTALAAWAHQNGGEPTWDGRQVCDQAERGHPIARAAVAHCGRFLGIGLANLMTLFAPDWIVLGGGLMQRWELFKPEVETVLQQSDRLVPWQAIRLTRSQMANPGLAGAAAVGARLLDDTP